MREQGSWGLSIPPPRNRQGQQCRLWQQAAGLHEHSLPKKQTASASTAHPPTWSGSTTMRGTLGALRGRSQYLADSVEAHVVVSTLFRVSLFLSLPLCVYYNIYIYHVGPVYTDTNEWGSITKFPSKSGSRNPSQSDPEIRFGGLLGLGPLGGCRPYPQNPKDRSTSYLPAPFNHPIRKTKYHLMETMKHSIEAH